jgi:hypothetical protein
MVFMPSVRCAGRAAARGDVRGRMCGGGCAGADVRGRQISNHYLLSKWGPLRRAVRYSFYVAFFLFNWAGCFQVPGSFAR